MDLAEQALNEAHYYSQDYRDLKHRIGNRHNTNNRMRFGIRTEQPVHFWPRSGERRGAIRYRGQCGNAAARNGRSAKNERAFCRSAIFGRAGYGSEFRYDRRNNSKHVTHRKQIHGYNVKHHPGFAEPDSADTRAKAAGAGRCRAGRYIVERCGLGRYDDKRFGLGRYDAKCIGGEHFSAKRNGPAVIGVKRSDLAYVRVKRCFGIFRFDVRRAGDRRSRRQNYMPRSGAPTQAKRRTGANSARQQYKKTESVFGRRRYRDWRYGVRVEPRGRIHA
jgi:hypothetical protein